ncbi:hypothetical protein [Antrihabitans sp. YC2-6]|uniref:hypothetical protein n=1 Tax=Antrihabitans sp. YC2-6 TaxID=2799498 RepID=UPI0018F699A5|nr:hypothetical protein [Antrihabitans sp. YC2-6]MBJ8344793.1 hypothetical protein [Antrihabitans sp. YC2-6]
MTSPFRDPAIEDGEKSVYGIRVGDDPTMYTISALVEHDGDVYVSSVDAGLKEQFAMQVEQRFRRENGRISTESYKAASFFEGQLVTREEGYFAGTQHLQFGGELQPFPKGVMPLIGGLTLLRGLDFSKGAKSKHDIWLAYSIYWPLEIKIEKRTTVKVTAGSFDAWQVKIRPGFAHINGLLDKVIAGFLPPFTAHFEASGSHRLLRFSFPTGPMPWNPRGTLELTA